MLRYVRVINWLREGWSRPEWPFFGDVTVGDVAAESRTVETNSFGILLSTGDSRVIVGVQVSVAGKL